MATEVVLPRQGNSVETCIIVGWKKAVGDTVAEGEPLLEVETDKATFEVESTVTGTLLKQLVAEGDDVPVLSPLAVIGSAGESAPPAASLPKAFDIRTPIEAPTGTMATGADTAERKAHADRIRISPRARRLAAARGLRLEGVTGSGPGGRIMVRDIDSIVADEPGLAIDAGDEIERVAVSGIRKVIAGRMRASLATTAQLTMNRSADARALLAYRSRLKASADPSLAAISINDLCLFALSRALRNNPELNATFVDGVIVRNRTVHLGFAVDTPRGLMVPVVKNAGNRTLADLASEAHRLASACQDRSVVPDELSGGTFTMTNLGTYGIESFTPVLNTPQVGILGVCAIAPKAVTEGAATSFIPSIGLCLTIDHQVVDGAPAAQFLQSLSAIIAEFELALAD